MIVESPTDQIMYDTIERIKRSERRIGKTVLGHDYTKEIIRCMKSLCHKLRNGIDTDDAVNQTESTYGYWITKKAITNILK